VKSFYAQNSYETGTKDTGTEFIHRERNVSKPDDINFHERPEHQTFPEGIEKQIHVPSDINYEETAARTSLFSHQNQHHEGEYQVRASLFSQHHHQQQQQNNQPAVTLEEKIKAIPYHGPQKQPTNSYTEDDADTIGGKASFRNEEKKSRNVHQRMEHQDSSLKVLNEGTIVISSHDDNESRKGKRNPKDHVTFGGVEVKELSHVYSGKYSKSAVEEDGGILLEKEGPQTGFCGFCKQIGPNKNSNQNFGCNIF